MIKTVIFDFDGVLVESLDIKTSAFAKLFEPEGTDVSKAVVTYHLSHAGVSRFEKFRHIYREILHEELTEDTFHTLCDAFSELVCREVVQASYVNGAQEFLTTYGGKYSFFIASATPQDEIDRITLARDMAMYFKGIYGAPKKKGDIVREVLSSENLDGYEVVYVGDAMSDYHAASQNGVHFIARVVPDTATFDTIDCVKVEDLTMLGEIIRKL